MNSRERFLAAINGRTPDRVPIVANLTEQLAQKLSEKLGLEVGMEDSFLATRISHREILLSLGNDAVLVGATRAADKPTVRLANGRARDEWGIEYETMGLYSEAVVSPLANCSSVRDLDRYEFPSADAPGRWDFSYEAVFKYKDRYGIIGDLEACIFELAWNLVGLEKFMIDLVGGEEYMDPLLDRLMSYSIRCGEIMVDMGADVIWLGDDIGTQKGMMISPALWRRVFKPRLRTIIEALKRRNPKIKIAYHSCGSILPIIPELIEIGLDILNPLQPKAKDMELSGIYERFSDRLVFFGGIDVQDVLPHGTVEDVRREVLRCIRATNGGRRYIIAPAHNMQPDTPVENVMAFFEAAKEYGVIR